MRRNQIQGGALPTVGALAARLIAVESMISQLVRDSTYDEFIRDLLDSIMKAVPSEAGSILEVDSARGVLFFRASQGGSAEQLSDTVIPLGKGLVGYVAESRSPVLVRDVAADPRHLSSISRAVGFDNRTLMAAPLVIRNHVFGVVEVFNSIGKPQYEESDLEILVALAESASQIIEARLMLNHAAVQRGAA